MNKKDFFDKITSLSEPRFIYLLGFLWGDGHIRQDKYTYTIVLRIQLEDAIALKSIFYDLDFCSYSETLGRGNRKPTGNFLICFKDLFIWMKDNDYARKSLYSACKIVSKIPENLRHYWFRGLMDADGSIKIHTTTTKHSSGDMCKNFTVNIYGAYEHDWQHMKNICDKLSIRYRITKRKRTPKGEPDKIHRSSEFAIGHRNDVILFCDYIWNNFEKDGIGLDRKYKKVEEIKKYAREKCKNFTLTTPSNK